MIPINSWQWQRVWRPIAAPLIMIVVLGLIAVIAPKLIPNERLQHLSASWLARILGHPVTTLGTSLRLLPTPELQVDIVRLDVQGEPFVRAKAVRLPMDLLGWFFGGAFRPFSAQKAIINPAVLLATLNEFKANNAEFPSFRIAEAVLNSPTNYNYGLTLNVKPLTMGRGQVLVSRGTETLTLKISRAGKALLLNLTAPQWHISKRIILTNISAHGRLMDGQLEFDRLMASLGTGHIRGALRVVSSKPWNITGSLTLEQVPIDNLLAWMGIPIFTGAATGTLYVSGTASDWTKLAANTSIFGQLAINSGTMPGIDIVTPARRLTIGDSMGGQTNFNHMQMGLERQGVGEWLATLANISGEDWNGRGLIRISGGVLLDGLIDVHPNGADSNIVPLLIAGTVSAARVRVAMEGLSQPTTEATYISASEAVSDVPLIPLVKLSPARQLHK